MRVFLDTNVLVSATATRGLCADVLREVFASHHLIVSSPLFKELRRVLGKKFGVAQDLVNDFIGLLQQDTILAEPGKPLRVDLRDKDDVPILASALSGKADIFVTGDKELLQLGRVGNIEILSPRQFWERLTAQQQRGSGRGTPRRSR